MRVTSWLGVVTLTLLHLPLLRYPGINYDEVMWVNAALGPIDKTFVEAEIGGYPVMIMSYIGAFKGYLYRLIFALFEPSPISLRLPMILLAGCSIALLSRALWSLEQRLAAVLLSLLLVISPTVGLHAHVDLGPSTIEFFFRCATLALMTHALLTKRHGAIWLLPPLFLLALWNKLSFIWFLNGLYGVLGLWLLGKMASQRLGPLQLLKELRQSYGKAPMILGVTAVLSYTMFLSLLLWLRPMGASEANVIGLKSFYVWHLLGGATYFNWGWTAFESPWEWLTLLVLWLGFAVALFSSTVSLVNWIRGHGRMGATSFLAFSNSVCAILVFIQIMLTAEANKPWHTFTLFPMLPMSSILGMVKVYQAARIKFAGRSWAGGLGAVATLAAVHFVLLRAAMFDQLPKPQPGSISFFRLFNTNTTTELYQFLKSQPGPVVFNDWGFQTQALFWDPSPKYKLHMEEFVRLSDVELVKLIRGFPPETLFVLHGALSAAFGISRDRFIAAVEREKLSLCISKTFDDGDGMRIAEIWSQCPRVQ
jgi:hypothetical protein